MSIENFGFLLIVAALVSIIARRLRMSYTVALVVTGIFLGTFPLGSQFVLSHDLIFGVLLPPLIFEAALNIRWVELKRDFVFITVMATFGLLASIAIIYTGLVNNGWQAGAALIFASLISATDPVSVIAILKEAGQKGRLRLLLEAESLFNDGTAAVVFVAVLSSMPGQSLISFKDSPWNAIIVFSWQFIVIAFGGILAGALVALVGMGVAGRTEDHLVELLVTAVVAFGSFLLAEHFHTSGVIATLTAGLLIGNYGRLSELTEKGRESIESFWEFAGFVSNSIVFLLMGIQYASLPMKDYWQEILFAIILVLIGRAVSVYGISLFFMKSRWKATFGQQHVLFWGGLRGALALALVLSLPADFPRRSELQAVTFSVVAFSVIVQGLSVKALLKKLKMQ